MSANPRQGVIFDEEQPDLLNPLNPKNVDPSVEQNGPFVPDEDSPLQRPRPPERTLSKRPQNRLSNRLSVMYLWNTNHNRTANGYNKQPGSVNSGQTNKRMGCCVIVVPIVLLSLVLIGVSALLIYLHLLQVLNSPEKNYKMNHFHIFFHLVFQEYHAEIDKLKSELQAARDKDGVFLPKETYDEQLKAKESADQEIKEKTLQIKAFEEQVAKLEVRLFWGY